MVTVSIGCDHAGFALKLEIVALLKRLGCEVLDRGCLSAERVDYPDFAALVARDLQDAQATRGILVCGTGIGMAITANKFVGVRAASLTDVFSAEMTRRHNDLNVLCLGARVVGPGLAEKLVEVFLNTPFEGGRHGDRLDKISILENE